MLYFYKFAAGADRVDAEAIQSNLGQFGRGSVVQFELAMQRRFHTSFQSLSFDPQIADGDQRLKFQAGRFDSFTASLQAIDNRQNPINL